jgi:hypothetical protein
MLDGRLKGPQLFGERVQLAAGGIDVTIVRLAALVREVEQVE